MVASNQLKQHGEEIEASGKWIHEDVTRNYWKYRAENYKQGIKIVEQS